MERRVVVTGAGVISPVGSTIEEFWDSLIGGRSGVRLLDYFDTSDYSSKVAGMVKGFNAEDYFSPKEMKRMDKFVQFAL
ncbi:MAG: beta-ketoacyl-[acyl-carrier-protein] synthase II, partial [Candidatus Abyssubacteria bacterium]|nr:beta-ketoacyl-[acyl-carrier-protein] synthase II [Candidatus Abyssubacteria bacterium]